MTSNGIGSSDQGMHFELLPKQYNGMTGPDIIEFIPISVPTETFNGMVQNLIGRFDNIDAIHRTVSSVLDEVEKSQAQNAHDQAKIGADQEEISAGFAEIRADLGKLSGACDKVSADQEYLRAEIEKLKTMVSNPEAINRELEMGDSGEPFLPLMQKVQRILDYVVSAGSRFKSYACLSFYKNRVKVAIGLCAIVAVSALQTLNTP